MKLIRRRTFQIILLLSILSLHLIYRRCQFNNLTPANEDKKQQVFEERVGAFATPTTDETAAVCAVAKNEDAYIDEWADFHLGLGFSQFFVYDNSDANELKQWGEERLHRRQEPINVTHYPGKAVQMKVYRECAERAYKQNYTWVWFGDVDEYIILREHDNIIDFLHDYASRGDVLLWWRVFGTSGRQNYQPIPVTKRFQYRVEDQNKLNHLYKSLVRLDDLNWEADFTSPHWFPLRHGQTPKSTDGTFPNQDKGGPSDVATIYHYLYKSNTEYIRKRMRGGAYAGTYALVDAAKKGIDQNGNPIPVGTVWDDEAWQKLKQFAPKYAVYDSF